MNLQEEQKAATILLDLGVSVPLRPLRFLKKKKVRRVTIRRPYMGTLVRIWEKYLSMGVKYEDLKNYTFEQQAELYAKHGKAISEMVAYCICRGYLSGKIFNRMVATWLRWRVHPTILTDLWLQTLDMLNVTSFQNIISLAGKVNILKPRLSHEESGS